MLSGPQQQVEDRHSYQVEDLPRCPKTCHENPKGFHDPKWSDEYRTPELTLLDLTSAPSDAFQRDGRRVGSIRTWFSCGHW